MQRCLEKEKTRVFCTNIKKTVLQNTDYFKILTDDKSNSRMQVTVQSVKGQVPTEMHQHVTQFVRVEEGKGELHMNGMSYVLEDGVAFIVPAGTRHTIINTDGEERPLKLFSIYAKDSGDEKWVH